jgi:RNA polymerase sigma-70 factor (ECF subfamily)
VSENDPLDIDPKGDPAAGDAVGDGQPAEDRANDQLLIEAAQRGDRSAFSALIQRHQGAVYGYLRARLLERADAEDLCQEVFLRCYTASARFDSPDLVRPWLIGIARNLLRERVRRVKRRREVAWTELCLELETWNPPDDQRHDTAVRLLPDCLDSLGPTAREALDLHYRGSLRLAAIGDRLHRSEGAVKLLLFRARQALRLCLNGKLRADPHD